MFIGSYQMQVEDEAKNIAFPVLILYPTETPSTSIAFGPYKMDATSDAPIAAGKFPLVIVSHGTGGSHLAYLTICTYLAQHGYVVAMIEHPGNNRRNNELDGTDENLVNRPRHVQLTIDAIASDERFANCVQADNVAVIGHSLGGYTALAVAGGKPWNQSRQRVEVIHDSRVKALILLAPAAAFYTPDGSLDKVTVPILLLVGEHDPYTPRWQADLVLDGVPDNSQVTFRVVENAGHFSFLSPFPAQMRSPNFLPATDPPGFDREAFHEQLPAELLAFLDEKLK